MMHNDKQIPKHNGSPDKRKRNDQSSSPPKKAKTTPIDGLKSLKAKVHQQQNSSILSLIPKAAVQE
jgi:hypothetical protein